MHSGSILVNEAVTLPSQPDWQAQLEHWRKLIVRCARKPGPRRVHALRVTTLRLQTQLEVWLPGHPADESIARAARRWIRQAEKLRRVLSPVRDADVSLGLLAGLSGPGGTSAQEAQEARDCLRAIARLRRRLQRRRVAAGKKLAVMLQTQRERLLDAGDALRQALAEPSAHPAIDCDSALRSLVAKMAAAAPALSATTLHDFRKLAKAGRYLAELAGPHDPPALRQVARFKAIQLAVGQWHDWQTLAAAADRIPAGCAGDALRRLLAQMAERSVGRALEVCGPMTPERHREKVAQPPRKPVRAVAPAASRRHSYA